MKKILTKQYFLQELKIFVGTLAEKISSDNEWTMRGVIDISEKIYPLPTDNSFRFERFYFLR